MYFYPVNSKLTTEEMPRDAVQSPTFQRNKYVFAQEPNTVRPAKKRSMVKLNNST